MPGVRASLATSQLSLSLSLCSLSGVRVLVSTFLAGVVSHARGACVTSHVPGWGGVPCQGCVRH